MWFLTCLPELYTCCLGCLFSFFVRGEQALFVQVSGAAPDPFLNFPEISWSPVQHIRLPDGMGHGAQVAERAGKGRLRHAEGPTAGALPANVLVAHLEEGLEIVHLYSGRTVCKLHLPPGGLHTDLNADGVPDHIQVILAFHANVTNPS